jgi:hypothetical protein
MPWDWYNLSQNINITWDTIDKPWNWEMLSCNRFENDPYFTSDYSYKKKMTKIFHDTIQEELIKTACHPKRVLNWMDEVNEPDCIYYGMTQADINNLFIN